MKKLFLIVAALLFMVAPATAASGPICPGSCPDPPKPPTCSSDCPTNPGVWGLFVPNENKEIGDCNLRCKEVGQYDWDGESIMYLDMTTGAGFCKAPDTCLRWLLCNCDSADEIEVNGKYGITVEIVTRGVSFESVASVNPPQIVMREYEKEEDMCDDINPTEQRLDYHFSGAGNTVIVTNAKRRLFKRNSLYISVCDLPRLVVDNRIVPYGEPIVLRLGLYDGTIVCQPDCSRMCECNTVVAIAACQSDCCAVLSYLPIGAGWWAGVAITNLDPEHYGSCSVAFVSDQETKVKTYRLSPASIKIINVGSVVDGDYAFAVIKSSFPMRAVSFGGDGASAFALPATGCGSCQ
jgi:hypothetical protein